MIEAGPAHHTAVSVHTGMSTWRTILEVRCFRALHASSPWRSEKFGPCIEESATSASVVSPRPLQSFRIAFPVLPSSLCPRRCAPLHCHHPPPPPLQHLTPTLCIEFPPPPTRRLPRREAAIFGEGIEDFAVVCCDPLAARCMRLPPHLLHTSPLLHAHKFIEERSMPSIFLFFYFSFWLNFFSFCVGQLPQLRICLDLCYCFTWTSKGIRESLPPATRMPPQM